MDQQGRTGSTASTPHRQPAPTPRARAPPPPSAAPPPPPLAVELADLSTLSQSVSPAVVVGNHPGPDGRPRLVYNYQQQHEHKHHQQSSPFSTATAENDLENDSDTLCSRDGDGFDNDLEKNKATVAVVSAAYSASSAQPSGGVFSKAHIADVPFHLTRSAQPPCIDIVPDVWSPVPLYWEKLRNVKPIDVWYVLIFLSVGPLAGCAAYSLEYVVEASTTATANLHAQQPYVFFLILPAGMAVTVFFSERFFKGTAGSGLPKTLLAFRLANIKPTRAPENIWDDIWNGGIYEFHISLRVAVCKWLACALAIALGTSVGPEGPAVQIGASIAAALQKLTDLPFFYPKGAIMGGAAIALSAMFNAPLTGLAFAIEELAGQYDHFGMRITVVASVGIGGLVLIFIHPFVPYLEARSPPFEASEWAAIPIIAIFCGFLGGAFSRAVAEFNKLRVKHHVFFRKARWNCALAAMMGFFIVLLGAFTEGSVYGVGNAFAKQILDASANGTAGLQADINFALFGPFKMLATMFAAFSGIPGGLFIPSLAVGAGWGTLMAYICTFANSQTVVILSMVAYFAGATQAPLTSALAVYEMTGLPNTHLYGIIFTATLAAMTSKIICPYPLYAYLVRVSNQLPQ